MTVPARISIVTLGVADLPRAVAFYEALGWKRTQSSTDEIAWFRTADTNRGLFPNEDLAADANLPPARSVFGGVTLAITLEAEADVARLLDEACSADARVVTELDVHRCRADVDRDLFRRDRKRVLLDGAKDVAALWER
jgi:catechol 2,3-dioxygenase-like lactoylglutathione lyase family enzyme